MKHDAKGLLKEGEITPAATALMALLWFIFAKEIGLPESASKQVIHQFENSDIIGL